MDVNSLHDDSRTAEDIFSKQLQILVKGINCEERNAKLSISAQTQVMSSSLFRKEFVVRLTDETDPIFYYYLRLNDEDYQSLRTQQGLLVDFTSFPQKFVELLDLCSREESKESPRFVLQMQLSNGSSLLNIVEINPFKHLVHLALKLVPGSDADVKRYLADTVKNLKQENKNLNSSLKSTESELGRFRREFNETLMSNANEIERLKYELKDQGTLYHEKYSQQLTKEKERVIQIQSELQDKYERERREIEYGKNKIISGLEITVAELEAKVRELTENKFKLESTVTETQIRINFLKNEATTARQEANDCRKDSVRLETAKKDAERAYEQVSTRLNTLEREMSDYETSKVRFQSALDAAKDQISRLEADLDQKNATLKIKTIHAKLKLRNQVTQEQEKVVQEKEKQVEVLGNQNSTLREEIRQQETELSRLRAAHNEAQIKLDEAQKTLSNNENLISYLNQKLNGAELNPRRGNPLYSSTPISAGECTSKLTSYSGSAEPLREPLDFIGENKEGFSNSPLSLNNNKENKSGSSANSKFSGPRPTLRGITSDKAKLNYNIRLPKTTVAPLGTNGATSRFPVTFPSSAYFAP
ncbi:Spindle assembly abnormal protein 6 [Chamberlinius hualienensis]